MRLHRELIHRQIEGHCVKTDLAEVKQKIVSKVTFIDSSKSEIKVTILITCIQIDCLHI